MGAPRRAFVFLISCSAFGDFTTNPSHWDGNPGIGIVNPSNPKQSQLQAEVQIAETDAKKREVKILIAP